MISGAQGAVADRGLGIRSKKYLGAVEIWKPRGWSYIGYM